MNRLRSGIWNSTIKIPELKRPLPIVPSITAQDEAVDMMTDFMTKHKGGLLVVTGAGASTDSGIPDYRGDNGTYVRNPNHRPILYQELVSSHNYRQRYWSRSYLGWPKMSLSRPNGTHHALVELLKSGHVQNILTQNVDYLHTKAETPEQHLLELHGTLSKVECMACGDQSVDRHDYQHRIHARNPTWASLLGQGKINPDGDVELPAGVSYDDFDIPPCLHCSSVKMKPKVVFFGENIQASVTQRAEKFVDECSGMLVIGSSLATYSSFRLARLAHQHSKPVGILTKGATRADGLMQWKAEVGCTAVLESVLENLIGPFFKNMNK